jgi:protein TorT
VKISSATNPYNLDGPHEQLLYQPLDKAQKKWKICISFPHLKDDYWLAVNYGVSREARRQSVSIELFEAGGYGNLNKQIQQIQSCAASGVDGIIIAAIDEDGLNPEVENLKQKGIAVVDLSNGMSSQQTDARSLVSFYQMGHEAGLYLVKQQKQLGKPVSVAWFPGPHGAAWVESGTRGFHDAIKKWPIKVVATRYGDVGRRQQAILLQEVFDSNDQLDFVVGTAPTILAALPLVRRLNRQTQLISYYMTRGIYSAIKRKQVLAAPTDKAVLQGRLAVDQVIRVLEKKPFNKHVGPIIEVIDQTTIEQTDVEQLLAPNGYTAEMLIE